MINVPKEVGRKYKRFDLYGWFMCILGLVLMCKFGGVGWIFGTDKNWWLLAAVFMCFWEYAIRVAYGRVYQFVYYDTILHNMYEIKVEDDCDEGYKTFFVNASSEEELSLYMYHHYPNLDYEIVQETHTESFIKREDYI